MKRFLFCTMLLINAALLTKACGPYYPFGDAVRFSIFFPEQLGYQDFGGLNYCASLYYGENDAQNIEEAGRIQNVLLWKSYCKNKVDTAGIYEAVYVLSEDDIFNSASNSMVAYLLNTRDSEALDYLKFAKRCSNFNTWLDDPWERYENGQKQLRVPLINEALRAIKSCKTRDLQKRYAFLLIRLSFYNENRETIEYTYKKYFETTKGSKDIIDYWALYFRALADTNEVKQNYYLALVFSHAPDKRLAILQHYNKKIPISAILALAKNNKERAAISIINNLQNTGIGLTELQTLYRMQPDNRIFSFLLIREINKLEDWIYTPFYTFFEPSVQRNSNFFGYPDGVKDYSQYALSHIERDRQYARRLLQFVNGINLSRVENPTLIKAVKAYLQFMTGEYNGCLATIRTIPLKFHPARIINALCLVAMQPINNCKIPGEIKNLLIEEADKKNNRFLFAIARELEYKNNTTEAALLYSKLNANGYEENGNVYWRTKKNYNTLWLDYYQDYFFYLDAAYSSDQMEKLLFSVNSKSNKKTGPFEQWLYSDLIADIDRLYDLLGTKYIRLNKLAEAYSTFRKADDSVWRSDNYSYYLNANPFYTNFYNEHAVTKADTIKYTKPGITANLINYLKLAEDKNNPKRDYYYFLAANCYFNMTQYGNSWMMRRYYWTSGYTHTNLQDDKEYFEANLARQYYLKAKSTAKTPQFASLCLRMAGRCEKYRKLYMGLDTEIDDNVYYREIKNKYPGDYDNLISNCYSFEKYLAARQNTP